MIFSRTVLILAAPMFGLFGVWLMFAPEKLSEWVGIESQSPAAMTELRAFYGGLEVGLAVFFLIAGLRTRLVASGCLALAIAMLGIAVARVLGLVLDGSGSTQVYMFLGSEVLFVVLGFLGWRRCEGAFTAAKGSRV